jgi:hypothetical protein
VFGGTGGTAVVYHDVSDYASLMALKGRTVQEGSADYTPGTPPAATTYSATKSKIGSSVFAGVTSVTFSRVTVVSVAHAGSAVEVTLQYGGVRKLPKCYAANVVNTSRSNIKTN